MRLVADNAEGRGGRRCDQARRGLLLGVMLALLSGCAIPADIDPRLTVANIFGAHLDGRLPPPGLDQRFPSLGNLPPRPAPVDRAALTALSESLAADRAQAAEPQVPGLSRSLAEGPPAAPNMRLPAGAPALTSAPAAPQAEPPAPADFLGVPAPPSGDLLAPRRP